MNKFSQYFSLSLSILGLMLLADPVLAAGGGSMPWESPLETIQESLTGPVAMVISLIGIFVAGMILPIFQTNN